MMKPYCKITLLIIFTIFSFAATAQTPPKQNSKEYKEAMEKAEKDAKEKAEEEAKAKAKEKERLRKLMEQQAKSEGSQTKMSESTAAAVNAKAEAFYATAMSQINSKHVAWIKQNAKKIFVDKMDDLAFKVMARFYGKNEGISEEGIEGLLVLLLREVYILENKAYNMQSKMVQVLNDKKTNLMLAGEMLADSSYQVSDAQLDSINMLVNGKSTTVAETAKEEKSVPDQSKKMPEKKADNSAPSNLHLTKLKLAESINSLSEAQSQQEKQMLEIKQHQQKITSMLSKMVNQVTEQQESIIKNLR
ncbi:MAG: hypothetical protein ABIP79_05685 [Chitinophagaceae bacterium]